MLLRLLLGAVLLLSAADPPFKVVKETYRGTEIEVRVPTGDVDWTKEFAGEVILGLTSGHAYLYIDGTRVDGAFLPIPAYQSSGRLASGHYIRFPDIPKEKVAEAKAALAGEFTLQGFSFSCVETSCANLRERLGVKRATGSDAIFLTQLLDGIVTGGFVDNEGKPVRFEIYKSSPRMPTLEEKRGKLSDSDFFYALASMVDTFMVGYIGYHVWEMADEKWNVRGRCGQAYRSLMAPREKEDDSNSKASTNP